MAKILFLIIFGIFAFFIFKTTTFGWRVFSKPYMNKGLDAELASNLKVHVYKLSQEIGERSVFRCEALEKAAQYITDELASFGYQLEFQEYKVSDKIVKNIIATKKGALCPEEIIIVGAHYDTCFNPGANDNASGVAGLLELARFASARQFNRTIKFIAFVNEEPPFFKTEDMGSRVYAISAKKRKENIKAVVILETIGYYSNKKNSQRYPALFGPFYPNKANFIAIVGDFASHWLVRQVALNFKRKTEFPIESVATFKFINGIDFSDHWPFWEEDFLAVMVTDTAFFRYQDYHQQTDTYEKLNYANMAQVIEGLSGVLEGLGEH